MESLKAQGLSEDRIRNIMQFDMERAIGARPGEWLEMHGSRHCRRVTLLAEATGNLYRKYLNEFANISDEDISLATAATAYHDSGRQGKEVDVDVDVDDDLRPDMIRFSSVSHQPQQNMKDKDIELCHAALVQFHQAHNHRRPR
jgi:hypothetical protein